MRGTGLRTLALLVLLCFLMVGFPELAAACVDPDGDGYGSPGDASCPAGSLPDCDSTRASVHPGALEVCDGIDDDCDGIVDDGFDVGVPCSAPGITRTRFVSDSTWEAFAEDPLGGAPTNPIGFAQDVCLNASFPASCPTDATLYGYPGGGWSADLSDLPDSRWIWAPGITGASYPADLEDFFFQKSFHFFCRPAAGVISVAADDYVEVRVNGTLIGSDGSTTDINQASAGESILKTFDISPQLVSGDNVLTIRGSNGPNTFGGCSTSCSYTKNPAGVVFGGSITIDTPAEICDGLDNDCDGVVPASESDADGDGFRVCQNDCNDLDPNINPGAVELPGNFVDENCDGNLGACDPCQVWSNHGQYVRCVAQDVDALVTAGSITQEEGDALVGSAAGADVGKKGFVPVECQP